MIEAVSFLCRLGQVPYLGGAIGMLWHISGCGISLMDKELFLGLYVACGYPGDTL